ncbi:hypothetical protein MNBD_GAMMA19-1202, partial [hydrothermal vent metagenome]
MVLVSLFFRKILILEFSYSLNEAVEKPKINAIKPADIFSFFVSFNLSHVNFFY